MTHKYTSKEHRLRKKVVILSYVPSKNKRTCVLFIRAARNLEVREKQDGNHGLTQKRLRRRAEIHTTITSNYGTGSCQRGWSECAPRQTSDKHDILYARGYLKKNTLTFALHSGWQIKVSTELTDESKLMILAHFEAWAFEVHVDNLGLYKYTCITVVTVLCSAYSR